METVISIRNCYLYNLIELSLGQAWDVRFHYNFPLFSYQWTLYPSLHPLVHADRPHGPNLRHAAAEERHDHPDNIRGQDHETVQTALIKFNGLFDKTFFAFFLPSGILYLQYHTFTFYSNEFNYANCDHFVVNCDVMDHWNLRLSPSLVLNTRPLVGFYSTPLSSHSPVYHKQRLVDHVPVAFLLLLCPCNINSK